VKRSVVVYPAVLTRPTVKTGFVRFVGHQRHHRQYELGFQSRKLVHIGKATVGPVCGITGSINSFLLIITRNVKCAVG